MLLGFRDYRMYDTKLGRINGRTGQVVDGWGFLSNDGPSFGVAYDVFKLGASDRQLISIRRLWEYELRVLR
jgi:hypothetical protein